MADPQPNNPELTNIQWHLEEIYDLLKHGKINEKDEKYAWAEIDKIKLKLSVLTAIKKFQARMDKLPKFTL